MKRVDRRRLAIGQAAIAGLVALVVLFILFGLGNAASQDGREMDLKSNGRAWELNPDASGHLWISDYQAGEIWHLNPATDVYTAYKGLAGASDGRLAPNGDLWWVNYDDYNFGRLDLDSDVRTIWPLTGTVQGTVSGLNFDAQGRVWIPDLYLPNLYRFDPQSNEFCHFKIPNNSVSYYIASHEGYLWLADWKLPYIYRINPQDDSYVQWLVGKASDPRGMTFDDDGNLWWSGLAGFPGVPSLARLSPDSIFVTFYTLPEATADPVMVDAWHDLIWFSDYNGRFGRFDPDQVIGNTLSATKLTSTLELLKCYQDWQPLSSGNTTKSTASAAWTSGVYSTATPADGWRLYQLPQDLPDWGPWGIRARQDGVWVVDQDRQKLVHIGWQHAFVPLVTK